MKNRFFISIFSLCIIFILSLFVLLPVSTNAQPNSKSTVLKIFYSGAQSGYLEPCG